jgi:hypothetical protein
VQDADITDGHAFPHKVKVNHDMLHAWVWPSPVATADVEAVSVALTQPEGDASSGVGRARTPEPWVVQPES